MKIVWTTLFLLLSPAISYAQNAEKELAEITFSSTDLNADNELSMSEVSEMTTSILVSMDADDNGSVSRSEFMDWDFGFHYLVEVGGDTDRYNAVKRVMFAVQDLNRDGNLDSTEGRMNTFWNFERADLNNDRVLSKEEYLHAWLPIIMMKAAKQE